MPKARIAGAQGVCGWKLDRAGASCPAKILLSGRWMAANGVTTVTLGSAKIAGLTWKDLRRIRPAILTEQNDIIHIIPFQMARYCVRRSGVLKITNHNQGQKELLEGAMRGFCGITDTVNKLRKYVRIFGALRQKPGFSLQFLDPLAGVCGISAAIPCATFGQRQNCERNSATSPLRPKGSLFP
jgi:hypothetical protein